jgi:hypothetical protein
MTAHRVIDDHSELENIGSLTHAQIDSHINSTNFVVVSGALPPNARRIRAGYGIDISDGGAGGYLTISATVSGSVPTGSMTVVTYEQTSWMEVASGAADGVNSTFTLSQTPNPSGALMFYVNGVLQLQGVGHDYTLSGSTISMAYTPGSGSNLLATYKYQVMPSTGPNTSWMEVPPEDADGINMIFTIGNVPNPASALMFYVNGVLQRQGTSYDYTLSGSTIAMVYAPGSGSNIVATYPY